MAIIVCDVDGYWVCEESWLTVKDSLTQLFNPPSPVLKAGHPVSCSHVMSCVCVDILGFVNMVVVVFIYLSISLPMAGIL